MKKKLKKRKKPARSTTKKCANFSQSIFFWYSVAWRLDTHDRMKMEKLYTIFYTIATTKNWHKMKKSFGTWFCVLSSAKLHDFHCYPHFLRYLHRTECTCYLALCGFVIQSIHRYWNIFVFISCPIHFQRCTNGVRLRRCQCCPSTIRIPFDWQCVKVVYVLMRVQTSLDTGSEQCGHRKNS